MNRRDPFWMLLAGLGLAALGFVLETPGQGGGTTTQAPPVLPPSGYGTSDSNGRMIAVTGVDLTGASILYLIDTETRHLSVYQASGGTESTSRLRWVGARNIDLDLKVDGYNDKSEYSFKALEDQFQRGSTSPGK